MIFNKCIECFYNNKISLSEETKKKISLPEETKNKIRPLCMIKFKTIIVYGETYYIIIGRCYPKCKLRHKLNFNEKLL